MGATPERPVCRTCANSGWIGSRTDPDDCPTCGRKPYWTVGDGTYPSPRPDPGGPVTIPDTPQPHWTVFYAPGDPLGILIWNNQWSLPMPDAGPEAYAALVADVEAAREVEDLRVTLDVTSARCREELDRVVTDRDALAATLATPLWTCPDCAFTYAAEHTDTETGENSCPVCAEAKLAYTLATARRLAQQWQTADIIDRIVLSKRLVRLLSDTPDTEERS